MDISPKPLAITSTATSASTSATSHAAKVDEKEGVFINTVSYHHHHHYEQRETSDSKRMAAADSTIRKIEEKMRLANERLKKSVSRYP